MQEIDLLKYSLFNFFKEKCYYIQTEINASFF